MILETLDKLFETRFWKIVVAALSIFLFVSFVQLLIVANQSINLIVDAADRSAPGLSAYINGAYYNGLLAIIVFIFLTLVQIANILRDRLIAKQYRSLAGTMMSFADGNISDRYKEQSSNEVNRLGRTFNHMADALQSLIEELRESEKRRKEIVADVAHDLAGPLTSISGYIETLAKDLESIKDSRQQSYLEIIRSNLRTLTHLINELSELSRLDIEAVALQKDLFSLRVLANDIISRYALEAKTRNITLTMEACSSEGMINADLHMIERVISNLVENAINYTPDNGSISLACFEETGFIILEVTDTGIGIPSEDLPFIFERFYRVNKDRSRHSGGSGLGLAIAREIIELHNGEISIASSPGKGTKITLKLRQEGSDMV